MDPTQPTKNAPSLSNYILGNTNRVLTLNSQEDNYDIILHMIRQCPRQLDVASRHLDPMIFDDSEIVAACQQLSRSHRHARIRILIFNITPLIQCGHRLLDLASRLSSYIEVRTPAAEHKDFNEGLMIAGGVGYVHQPLADRYEGTANFYAPQKSRELLRQFEELWQTAVPDPNLRRLHI